MIDDATALDVIGDVHGQAAKLTGLLELMGYRPVDGVWSHSERRAVFIGDLIDGGPFQVETLAVARTMIDAGQARIVLGNHEFNAVSWVTRDDEGEWCRSHSDGHTRQHEQFLRQVGEGSAAHHQWLDWFRTIPLWLELDGLRLVHACWSSTHMDVLRPLLTTERTLTDELVRRASVEGSSAHEAIELVLKGPEIDLGGDRVYLDKSGIERTRARFRWWDRAATTRRHAAHIAGGSTTPAGEPFAELPDDPIDTPVAPYADEVPVIVGHYWFTGQPAVLGPKLACVDYSAGHDGPLVAYRWDGERDLDSAKFVSFPESDTT